MFLKRIILQGFKSFADRTEFEFGDGITAIVGPNGCGKSNVVDAVRWVLGEQSARSLRGEKMADVIFAGSRSRKPANFAEVTLVFDNRRGILRCDSQEVTVGRVLYRSGESEYRLNGNPCRRKDIRELLLDTGIGVDAYSFIEQGRVDSLLQANPLERRELFEEAAGISRYKVRRAEAQRKLERTEQNLARLQDIVTELEHRLRSVRLAAGKARNYQQYDARLRELRSTFTLAEYHGLEQARLKSEQEIAGLNAELQELRAVLASCDAEAAELERDRQRLDEQIQAADRDLLDLQTGLSALAERIAQAEKRLPELAAARDRRQTQAAEMAARLSEERQRLADEQAALEALRQHERELLAQVEDADARYRAAEQAADLARQRLEQERLAAFEAARQEARLQNERENRSAQQARLTAQLQRLVARQQELLTEQQQVATQLAGLLATLERLEHEHAELGAELRRTEERWQELLEEIEQVDGEIGAVKETRSAVASRLALLEDMERRLEGVARGTQAVLAWREDPQYADLVAGLVADLLRIDDPRVAVLQPVLANFEDHVVVRDTERFLSELQRRGGPVGPLRVVSLDRLERAPALVRYDHVPGFVARAADWVRCGAEFRALAEHLLGRTFVVDRLETALALARQALAGCVFVTLAGEVVGADARLSFAATQTADGLISRKAQIRQLMVERDDLEHRLVTLTRRRLELDRALSDLQLHKSGLMQQIATQQRQQAELRQKRGAVEEARQRLEREAGLLADELATARRSHAELTAQLESLQAEQAAISESQQDQQARIDALAQALAECQAEVARRAAARTAAQVESGRAMEKRAAAEEALRLAQTRLSGVEREQQRAAAEAAEIGAQIQTVEQELRSAREQQEQQRRTFEQRQAEALRLREQRQQLLQRLEQCGSAARDRQRQIEAREATMHERQVILRETEVRQENLVSRLRDELGLDLRAAYDNYQHTEQDWEAIRAEIEELRAKIARLGNVNLDAIAELEELTPRYDRLVSQRDDLMTAKARLETLIRELDEESRTRFAAAFENIRRQFQEVFRKLFGGGKADIYLEDPQQPLECGIEIVARPPGKEPQALSLLSGGEKTLAAIALLFGVFRSRPSPFAFLDEVDAALDEPNTERFNALVQEFLSQTQFVVITHSKRTMANADVLYGVTMEEPGVSKRVGVRFEECVQAPYVA